jgi:hypothetical protein
MRCYKSTCIVSFFQHFFHALAHHTVDLAALAAVAAVVGGGVVVLEVLLCLGRAATAFWSTHVMKNAQRQCHSCWGYVHSTSYLLCESGAVGRFEFVALLASAPPSLIRTLPLLLPSFLFLLLRHVVLHSLHDHRRYHHRRHLLFSFFLLYHLLHDV